MFSIKNFTKPYIYDVLSFSHFLLGELPLSETQWESFISDENKLCKIIIDDLQETLGYMVCDIISPELINELTGSSIKGEIGFFYHAAIEIEDEQEAFAKLLLEQCVEDLNKKGITTSACIINADHASIPLFHSLGFKSFHYNNTHIVLMK